MVMISIIVKKIKPERNRELKGFFVKFPLLGIIKVIVAVFTYR